MQEYPRCPVTYALGRGEAGAAAPPPRRDKHHGRAWPGAPPVFRGRRRLWRASAGESLLARLRRQLLRGLGAGGLGGGRPVRFPAGRRPSGPLLLGRGAGAGGRRRGRVSLRRGRAGLLENPWSHLGSTAVRAHPVARSGVVGGAIAARRHGAVGPAEMNRPRAPSCVPPVTPP